MRRSCPSHHEYVDDCFDCQIHKNRRKESAHQYRLAHLDREAENRRKWNKANPDKIRAHKRRWREHHREKKAKQDQDWRWKHKDKVAEWGKQWQATHREERRERYRQKIKLKKQIPHLHELGVLDGTDLLTIEHQRKSHLPLSETISYVENRIRAANHSWDRPTSQLHHNWEACERTRERHHEWRKANPDKCKEYKRRYRQNHPDRKIAQEKAWRSAHKDKVAEWSKRWHVTHGEQRRERDRQKIRLKKLIPHLHELGVLDGTDLLTIEHQRKSKLPLSKTILYIKDRITIPQQSWNGPTSQPSEILSDNACALDHEDLFAPLENEIIGEYSIQEESASSESELTPLLSSRIAELGLPRMNE
jgi:hypothetical protein